MADEFSLFNSVRSATDSIFAPHQSNDLPAGIETNLPKLDPNNKYDKIALDNQDAIKTQETVKDLSGGLGKVADMVGNMFKAGGQTSTAPKLNLQTTTAPNLQGLAAPITPNFAANNQMIGIPQLQAAPMIQPMATPAPQPLNIQMSDYRTKKNIELASSKLDALLNRVYENVVNAKRNSK